MSESRFVYRERRLTPEEADARWTREYEHLVAVRNAAQNDLDDHLDSHPANTVVEQIELKPGDDGYDKAPVAFDPSRYQGTFQWNDISTSS